MKKIAVIFSLILVIQTVGAQTHNTVTKQTASDTLAFDGVPFGVTKDEIVNKYHKAWFDDGNTILIGDDFYHIRPKFTYDGKLLEVAVMKEHNIAVDYPKLIVSIKNLSKTVNAKYGAPSIVKKMPTTSSIRAQYPDITESVYVWKVGDKSILVGSKMVIDSDNARTYYSICAFTNTRLMMDELKHKIEQFKEAESNVKSMGDSLNKASSSMF